MTLYVGYTRPNVTDAAAGHMAGGAAAPVRDLSGMTKEQLRALAAERGINAPSRATKDALVALLGA